MPDRIRGPRELVSADCGAISTSRGAHCVQDIFPQTTADPAATRKKLAPHIHDAFTGFRERVFAEGALPTKTKQLIAVAAAHVTQCPYCIRGHTKAALRHGATAEEIMEAIWVAAEMGAGGAYAHPTLAVDTIEELNTKRQSRP